MYKACSRFHHKLVQRGYGRGGRFRALTSYDTLHRQIDWLHTRDDQRQTIRSLNDRAALAKSAESGGEPRLIKKGDVKSMPTNRRRPILKK